MKRSEAGGLAAWTATTLTRVLLLLYPPAFRKDAGHALVADVGRRAVDLASSRTPARVGLWLARLTASLVANALAAWIESLRGRRSESRLAVF